MIVPNKSVGGPSGAISGSRGASAVVTLYECVRVMGGEDDEPTFATMSGIERVLRSFRDGPFAEAVPFLKTLEKAWTLIRERRLVRDCGETELSELRESVVDSASAARAAGADWSRCLTRCE